MEDTVICLTGRSGSGKTTIADLLYEFYGFNLIRSRTTRKPRHEGERREYVFMTEPPGSDEPGVIGWDQFNGVHYWAKRFDYKKRGISVYAIEPQGAQRLEQEIGHEAAVVIIWLEASYEARLMRLQQESHGNDWAVQRLARDNDGRFEGLIKCDFVYNTVNVDPESVAWDIAVEIKTNGRLGKWRK